MTASSDLARALVRFVRARPGGLWHVANSGATTWFDIAEYVGALLGRDEGFATPIESRELAAFQVAARPTRSDLDTHRFAARWESLPEWHGAVERLVNDRRFLETPREHVENDVMAVVVDYHADDILVECVGFAA